MTDITERYQWIKGENLGVVEIVKNKQPKDSKFLAFDSGNKCNKEILEEYLIQISHDQDILSLDLAQNEGEVNEAIVKAKVKRRNAMISGLSYEDPINSNKPEIIKTPIEVKNPLIPVIERSKKEKIKLNSRLNLELPNKDFITVMQNSFEDDILEVLSNYALSKIKDPSKFLQKLIKASLKDWYSN